MNQERFFFKIARKIHTYLDNRPRLKKKFSFLVPITYFFLNLKKRLSDFRKGQITDINGLSRQLRLNAFLAKMRDSQTGPKTKNYRDWYSTQSPELSIVVLNYNKSELTISCVNQIVANTVGVKYEVIVVDNCSGDEDYFNLHKNLNFVKLIRLNRNRYFGEGNNIGVEAANGEFILLLNNDAFIQENTVLPLLDLIKTDPQIGSVGPKFFYPDGRLQEVGAIIDSNGFAEQLGKNKNPEDPEFFKIKEVDYCSAACLLVRKYDYIRVGGFDMCWEPAYYEDTDLCFKLRSIGKKNFVNPNSTIIHIENFTTSDSSLNLNLHTIVEINRYKFTQRWFGENKYAVPANYSTLNERGPEKQNSLTSRKTLALYSPYELAPGGGERYLLTIAALFQNSYDTYLLVPEKYSYLRLTNIANELELDLSNVKIRATYDVPKGLSFDIFICMANEILPDIPALGRLNFYHCQFPFPINEKQFLARFHNLDKYDSIIVNSQYTKNYVEKLIYDLNLPKKPAAIIYPPCVYKNEPISLESKFIFHDNVLRILSVGRFFMGGHSKRHDILIKAFKELVSRNSRIKNNLKFELHIAGAVQSTFESRESFRLAKELAENLDVYLYPNASTETLNDLLGSTHIYWHATGYDIDTDLQPEKVEHFGIAIVEAMAWGCIPFVVNNGGPLEIVKDQVSGFHYKNISDLVASTMSLIEKPDELITFARRAKERALDFSSVRFMEAWQAQFSQRNKHMEKNNNDTINWP